LEGPTCKFFLKHYVPSGMSGSGEATESMPPIPPHDSSDAQDKLRAAPLKINLWKKLMLASVVALFALTLLEYYRGEITGNGAWLWPLLFVPLMMYLLGIVYGDVPARYYNTKLLKPFPVPFARQFDRCVLALVVLYTGLFLNIILLAVSLLAKADLLVIIFYGLYMALMLAELPNSLRIFRLIQHVNTVQYVSKIDPNTFRNARAYYSPESQGLSGEARAKRIEELYQSLKGEAESLVLESASLGEKPQIALNLAVRAGESIRRARLAKIEGNKERLEANLQLLEALECHCGLSLPEDLAEARKERTHRPSGLEEAG